jgi:RecA-family ATPase
MSNNNNSADNKLPGTRLKDFLEEDMPEITWPVKEVLTVGATTVAGQKNSYKSTLMRTLALSVALGEKFLDTFPTEQGAVLYIALEDSREQLQELFEKMLENRDVPIDADPDLIIITGEEFEQAKSEAEEDASRKNNIKLI